MSRFNSYPDGYILQPGDRILVSRQGRTLSVTGAGVTAGATPAEQFDDYKRYNDARVQALTAQNARLIALVEAATGNPLPSLNALYLSSTAFTAGTMFNATIAGATPGSTITATADDGTTLNVSGGLLSGTFTTAGSKTITLTEALEGYFNSPNPTLVQVAVADAGTVTPTPTPTLNTLTVSPSVATVGTAYSGTITGLTSGSSIALSGAGSAGLSIAGAVITGTPTTAGAVNIVETLAGATNSPNPSNAVVTVSAATAFAGYDVILLAGQSNMVGRYGPIDATLDATDDRIMQYGYDAQTVTLAANPLDSRDEGANTVGPGLSIAKAYIADGKLAAGRKVLLVPVAMGNTAFNTGFWRAGGSGDTQAIARANAAMALSGGTNQFIMTDWHQGEGDRTSSQATYSADLDALIARWRSSITGATNSPFIVGALLIGGAQTTTAISTALSDTPNRVAYTAFVDSTGLTSGGDNLHFDAASQRIFGGRYYSALATAKANNLAPTAPAQVAGLNATPSSGQVALAWTAPSSNRSAITDYIVEYKTSASSTWLTFADGTSTATTATVTGLTNATAYDFRVAAVNAIGTGPVSTVVTSTPVAAPAGGLNATFTGADNTPMSSYTTDSGHTNTQTVGVSQILGNALAATTVPSEGTFSYAPPTINQTIKWRTIVHTKAGNCYIRYRVVDAANYYFAGCGANGASHTLAAFTNSSSINFAGAITSTPAFNVGDTLDYQLVITGANGSEVHTLSVSVNGGAMTQVFSGSPSAGAQTTLAAPGLIGWRQSGVVSSATVACQLDNITATAA